MKRILFHRISIILFWVLTLNVNAQTDTVCINQTSHYWLFGGISSVFNWNITGGTILNGQGNDSITVTWSNIPGNYKLNVVEINNSGCKGDTNQLNIVVLPNFPISISGPSEICIGETITLKALNSYTQLWSTGDQSDSIQIHPTNTTIYQLIGKNFCSTDTLVHLITVHPLPVPDFSYTPTTPQKGENVYLTYTGSPVNNWDWHDEQSLFSNNQNPDYLINKTTQITLYVTDIHNCSDSIHKMILVDNQINIWVPNAFSPNGDGLNDVFKAECEENIDDFELFVYNRWGQLLFKGTNLLMGWDGTFLGVSAPPGIYTWILNYNVSKNNKQPNRYSKQGTLTLIR
jgi:gliding motility-associated-like protein